MKAERLNFLKEGMKYYEVDLNRGIVFQKNGKPMKPYRNERGYLRVAIYYKGKQKVFYVHQVISYMGGLDVLNKTVNHKDGNKENNSISNLETMSLKDNLEHAFSMGLSRGRFLDDAEKKAIVSQYRTGKYTMMELAKKYNVSGNYISRTIIEANNGKRQKVLKRNKTA